MVDVLECFRIKETGKVYCYVTDEKSRLCIQHVDFYEVSENELPEDVRRIIKELEE